MDQTWTLRVRGHSVAVRPAADKSIELLRDDTVVDTRRIPIFGAVTFDLDAARVKVGVGWGTRISKAVLRLDGSPDDTERDIEFDPPPGSRKAKLAALKQRRPKVYAARHIGIAALEIIAGVLGLNLLLRLLPDLNIPKPDLPDLNLPSIPLPSLDLPDISLPGWVGAIAASAKYWIPVLIAIGIAANEVGRRQRAAQRKRDIAAEGSTATGSTAAGSSDENR
ncbi:hypothetical protein ACHIPZ_04710 [Antrihabitans sp. NCIMB 15449]|uniref:Uncharacterized protein n=1 Tax=Antrihabitans spumae TaxID=3373370 RepID=A0ABW7JHU0_9NOCA